MKQKRMKKIISLTIAAAMAFTAVPMEKASAQEGEPAAKTPLVQFDMEALDGNSLTNLSNGETVEVTGNPRLEKGKEGESALRFDGDTYIDLGTSFQPEKDYTLMGWIRQDSGATDGQTFVSRSYSGVIDDQLGIMLKNGTVIHEVSFKSGNGNTDYQAITSPADAPQGRWNHIAVIRSGGEVNIYINGELSQSQGGLTQEPFAENSKNMYVGRDCNKSGVPYAQHAYRGLMDDLRLYDTALDQAEVTEIYESCRNGFLLEEISNGRLVLKLDKVPQSPPEISDFNVEFKDGNKYLFNKINSCEYNSDTQQVTLSFDELENYTQGDKIFSISVTYQDDVLSGELTVPSAGNNQVPEAVTHGVLNRSQKLGSEPHVKGMLEVSYDFHDPDGDSEGDTKYQWYSSDTLDGEYTPIQGIRTRTVILLDAYEGKYLKCEVTPADCYGNVGEPRMSAPTEAPVQATEGNPLTDWMYESGYGVSHHFLSNYFNLSHVYSSPEEKWDRSTMTWDEFVGQFDAEAYAKEIHDIGAKFVILTLGQNSGSYCAPNMVYDQYMREAGLLGEGEANPKTVSMENDLPMRIADALEKYDINLILYLPSNPPHSASRDETGTPNGYGYFSDYLVTKKVFDYTPGTDGVPNQRSRKVLSEMVEWWSQHYGDKISGWWFDGCYPSGILQSQMDMSLEYNLSTLANAAKAGNPYSIVTFNQGLNINWAFNKSNPYQDYTAGESQGLDTFPVKGRWAKDSTDCQNFMFGPIGNRNNWSAGWGCSGTSRTEEFMIEAVKNGAENQYAMGFDTKVNIFGHLDPDQYKQLVTLKEAIRGKDDDQADLTQLKSLYNAISKMDLSNYTEDSAAVLNTAMEHAATVLEKDNATKTEAAEAESGLLVALAGLEKIVTEPEPETDKSLAKALYNAYKELNLSGYTEASAAVFTKALDALDNIIKKEDASQEAVDSAVANLLSAASALAVQPADPEEPEIKVDFSVLNMLYNAYAEVDTTKYTKETADALLAALHHAEEVLKNEEADQAAVDGAAAALAKAAAELTEEPAKPEEPIIKPDMSMLKVLYDAYAGLDTGKYTDASAKALKEAVTLAASVLNNAKADQDQIDQAASKLMAAATGLELKPAEIPQPEKPAVPALKKGQILTYKGLRYKVTNPTPGKATVLVAGASSRNVKKVTVPSTVTLKGIKCKVTKIGQKSFKGYKKLQEITIGANVTAIGQQAFYGDSKLKYINIKSKVLTHAYSKSLKGISANAKINVPDSKVNAYKKIFKNRGQKSSVVIK
ncbi:LamG-like jellyroll fold domain-containing protein [uncultured Robinsoniella sp.]|uniref:LamG-like jellyroll fold domain-containing protein n=1 Tax=uncultured Robinsoniella sp. TaxID=904190 RepID=UPI00374E96CE